MNNEPYGWVKNGEYVLYIEKPDSVFNYIPLYTHPVKEQDGCGNCHACLVGVTEHGLPVTFQRMILCPDCGNKRCPKASNHRYQCTESNEPNQRGSIYTHPAKEHFEDEPQAEELHKIMQSNAELTDEEIGDFEYQIIRACGLSTANSDINPIGLRQIIKDILRKAQE